MGISGVRSDWPRRFGLASFGFPVWAESAPRDCAVIASADGLPQLFHWDRDTGGLRQLTQSPHGVDHGRFDPTGEWLWWFAFAQGGDAGAWLRAPFDGGRAVPGFPGAPTGHPEGLGVAADGTAVAAFSGVDGGTAVYVTRPGEPTARLLRGYDYPAYVGGIAPDGRSLLLVHAQDSDPRRPALRLIDLDGAVLAELDRRPGAGVDVLPYDTPFHPDGTAVLVHEERADGHRRPLVWRPAEDRVDPVDLDLPGDLQAQFAAGGAELLVRHRWHGRSTVVRCGVDGSDARAVPTRPGTVHAVGHRPDGAVWYLHSSTELPPALYDDAGRLFPADEEPLRGRPVDDLWVDGPGGPVHALLTRSDAADGPGATVVLLHGGPGGQDGDEFLPEAEAWADLGYHVVRVNHRGSGGYGAAWRHAHDGAVGATELADIEAVRAALVADGVTDPARCVLAGRSWGAFLVLLGLGTAPELWACGVAESPIADFAAAYDDELEQLRALDRALFGGSPAQLPGAYAAASPSTYAAKVTAPVLIIFGEHDQRCPPGQIEDYVRARQDAGGVVDVVRHGGGHGAASSTDVIDLMARQVDFVAAHAPTD